MEHEHQHSHQHHGPENHHHEHAHTAHAAHTVGGPVSWGMAARATLHCLTGCAIGEVLGMIIGTALGWGNVSTMILAIVLAFFFGYALTLRGVLAAGSASVRPSGWRWPRTPFRSPSWS